MVSCEPCFCCYHELKASPIQKASIVIVMVLLQKEPREEEGKAIYSIVYVYNVNSFNISEYTVVHLTYTTIV